MQSGQPCRSTGPKRSSAFGNRHRFSPLAAAPPHKLKATPPTALSPPAFMDRLGGVERPALRADEAFYRDMGATVLGISRRVLPEGDRAGERYSRLAIHDVVGRRRPTPRLPRGQGARLLTQAEYDQKTKRTLPSCSSQALQEHGIQQRTRYALEPWRKSHAPAGRQRTWGRLLLALKIIAVREAHLAVQAEARLGASISNDRQERLSLRPGARSKPGTLTRTRKAHRIRAVCRAGFGQWAADVSKART